jgi:predicted nucleic acid-binding protein
MTPLFADTSFYIAAISPGDVRHSDATKLLIQLRRKIVTTDYVLTEMANLLSRGDDRTAFLQFYVAICADPHTEVIPSSRTRWMEGFKLFSERPDKNWSLTDCISFAVMQQRGLTEALTADHHFEQAGFKVLLDRTGG